ncbi:DUF397 domain-containing protein [Streptomyces sp. NPDC002537]
MTNNPRPADLEVADENAWFTSSYSNEISGADCVSVAPLAGQVGIRDSKQPDGPAVAVPTASWTSFVDVAQSGELSPA